MFFSALRSLAFHRVVAGSLVAATLLFGLTLTAHDEVRAGGGPGSGGDYITFSPGAITLDRTGVVTFTGTVTCKLPGEAVINANLEQVAGRVESDNPFDPQVNGLVVDAYAGAQIDCPQAGTQQVSLTFVGNHPRGFRPGSAQLALDFDSVAHDPATGFDYPSFQFGIIPVQLSMH